MAAIFLHTHPEFLDLLNIVSEETGIAAGLVEKDYWIMHSLYGLTRQGYDFQLKGGTSLSKGFDIIDRFSEDIDLHITPPAELGINENPRNNNPGNIQKKKAYYDRLVAELSIPGIQSIKRDYDFDDCRRYNSGGIRLYYESHTGTLTDLKEGILLEAGYDTVAPNMPVDISSWAYNRAKDNPALELIDNRATGIRCYDYRYTFVEKLQTIAAKFRKEATTGLVSTNYMRQYYDVYALLSKEAVQDFIGTEAYREHKRNRFAQQDFELPIHQNEAFLLNQPATRERLRKRYEERRSLYYKGQPSFEAVLARIHRFIDKM